jgi:hypothetical protein
MSRQRDHDLLVATLSRELELSPYQIAELARKLRRAGATLQRLAEAQCNGDYPYDNGERPVVFCGRCQSGAVRSSMKRCKVRPDTAGVETIGQGKDAYYLLCPDCRTQDRVTTLLAEHGLRPIFQGDPRGPVFKVIPPSYAARNAGRPAHDLEGIYVS